MAKKFAVSLDTIYVNHNYYDEVIAMRVSRFSFSKSLLTTTALTFMGMFCFSSVAFATEPEDREKVSTVLTSKRKALEDKNSSKKTKLSASEDLNADNSLVAVDMNTLGAILKELNVNKGLATLPDNVIDIISTFLSPNECFKLALTCQDLRKRLPNLPMWQDLIDRSQVYKPSWLPSDASRFNIFQLALNDNYYAKFIYASWLLSYDLNERVAARQLSEIINDTEAAPLEICNAIHLIENFSLWNKINSEIEVNNLLVDMSTQHPQFRDITDYLRAVMRVQNRTGNAHLPLPDAYQLLVGLSQSPHLPAGLRVAADYYRAVMRDVNLVRDDLLPISDAYQLLVVSSRNQDLFTGLRAEAVYRGVRMRVHDRIGENILTLPDAYQLLVGLSQNTQLLAGLRAEADYYRALMRLQHRIGEDLLTLPDTYQLLVVSSQNPQLPAGPRAKADYYRAMMRVQGLIENDLLTDLAAYQLLVESSQNPQLPAGLRAEADYYRAMMRVQNRIGAVLLPNPNACQLLVRVSQNPQLPKNLKAKVNHLINQLKTQNRIPTSMEGD
ncbi:MAG: hypothetical protein HYX35_04060 [Proteobacteria bacterium]|nr:hypothetical protein [Pseudomonadota bacterium]